MSISQSTSSLWAKKKVENGKDLWLPLVTHLIDTKNVMNWLYQNWLSDSQRQLFKQSPLGANLEKTDVEKLVKFIGFCHDIGKATPVFQRKPSHAHDAELDTRVMEQLLKSGFAGLNVNELSNTKKSPHATAGEALLERWQVPVSIGAIIGGHHGLPLEEKPDRQIDAYTNNYFLTDEEPDKHNIWLRTQTELFEYGLNLAGYRAVNEIPSVDQPQAVILEGLLIMADWLASSEYLSNEDRVELFPLVPLNTSWKDIDTEQRFKHAMANWNLSGHWLPQVVSTSSDPYQKRWGFDARPVQAAITKAVAKTKEPGMLIVEAPTGLGKTEIALVAAEQLAYIDGENGVFMGLPTQATTNAMFDRVDDWLEKVAQSQDESFSIKLMHGKARFNKHYERIPNASNVEDPSTRAASVTVNGWFSGKKSILTEFTVGTIDHLLLMGLKQKHLFLRHLGLSGKVVIIDEVHAYDSFMNQYLYKAINWLGAYHVPLVILSATLPKAKRNALIEAYLVGKYGTKHPKNFKAPKNWQESEAYPLVSIVDGTELKQVTKFEGNSDQKPFHIQVKRINPDNNQLIQAVLAKISEGGVAGIIVNTVKRAQALAKLVPKGVELMMLHSAFLAPAREVQEEKLQKAIGKRGQRPKKMIVIGTQVLEQSLDIDFDVLYTDIAPMDLILQRAGRMHRHQIKRPKNLQTPELFVMGINGPGDYGKANEFIYQKYLLMKTDYSLGDRISIPQDVSKLVQAVYEQANDNQIPVEQMPSLADVRKVFNDYVKKESAKAQTYQVNSPNYFADLHGWLTRPQKDIDQDEQKASAAVRDIQETLEVVLLQHTDKGDFLIPKQTGQKPTPIAKASNNQIAQQVIRIPAVVTAGEDLNKALDELTEITSQLYPNWQNDVWLKGSLALPLDNHLTATLGSWQLSYSTGLGMSYVKESHNDN